MLQVMPMMARPRTQRARRHVVVCVDDDPRTLAALRRSLQREPYEVVTLESPGEALEYLEERQVSVLIADQRMPEMAGSDLLRSAGELSPDTARVILTGFPESAPADDRLFHRLMLKPWDDEQLRRTIRALLREHEREAPYLPE